MARRLALVFAHPDDDTFGVAGTIALHGDEGLQVLTILATSGEAGPIADPALATRENLGEVREAEARESYQAIGAPDVDLRFLRYPDGELARAPRAEVLERVTGALVEFRPDVVVTFGPDGITGHEDHVTIGEIATEAFHRARAASDGAFHRLLQVAIPTRRIERWRELQRMAGQEPFDPQAPFAPRGVPDEDIAVEVDTSTVWERTLEALRAHRTQAEEMETLPPDSFSEIFGREHYVQAWPERRPEDPHLGDVFDGLPLQGT